MKIVPADITHKTFNKKLFGYDNEDVLAFLQEVAHEMEDLMRENNNLKEIVRDKEIQILKYKEKDKAIKETIETAQKMSQKMQEEADREGRLIVNDAQQKADFIVRDAKDSLKRIYHEISDLKRTKVQIEANLRALLQAHLQLLNEQITALPEVGTSMPQSFLNEQTPHSSQKEHIHSRQHLYNKSNDRPSYQKPQVPSHPKDSSITRSAISPVSS